MNKPIKKQLMPVEPGSSATNRINIFNTGYNKACEEWEAWLESQKEKEIKSESNRSEQGDIQERSRKKRSQYSTDSRNS